MTIKEAAATYQVSRAKLHRLIRLGRLPTEKDPRDERATLLKAVDLESLFRFSGEEAVEDIRARTGLLTAELRARIDALRVRLAAGEDSVDIIRAARERRSADVYDASAGREA